MKNIFFYLLFLPFGVFSQAYVPMLGHDSEWHVTSCFSGCITDVYYTDGDTLFNGQTYTVLNGYHYISRTFWLREDVQEKKVFMSIKEPNKAREELLLYDFSLEVGDSIDIFNPISPLPTNPGYFKVDSIASIQLYDGLDYRHFYLSPTPSTTSSELPIWIESVGSLCLINTPGGTSDINNAGKLSCHINDGQVVYSQLDSISGCEAVYVAALDELTHAEVEIYPNPFQDEIWIHATENIESIEVSDMKGGKMLSVNKIQQLDINLKLDSIPPGIYFIELMLDSGKILNKKLIKD